MSLQHYLYSILSQRYLSTALGLYSAQRVQQAENPAGRESSRQRVQQAESPADRESSRQSALAIPQHSHQAFCFPYHYQCVCVRACVYVCVCVCVCVCVMDLSIHCLAEACLASLVDAVWPHPHTQEHTQANRQFTFEFHHVERCYIISRFLSPGRSVI